MLAVQATIDGAGLDPALADLCKTRASQMNGCSFWLAMHTFEARQRGESEERLHMVAAWREAMCYSPAERAALAVTESLTSLPGDGVSDALWTEAVEELGEANAGALL